MNIERAIAKIDSSAQYVLVGDSIEGITWLSDSHPSDEEIEAMMQIPKPIPEDWDGFRAWRRQNPDYLALMGGPHGNLVGFLEADISRGDYASAAVLWDSLKQQGAISTSLETALTNAIAQFNLGELGAALTAHNQAQN
jgi:hypothetical protein